MGDKAKPVVSFEDFCMDGPDAELKAQQEQDELWAEQALQTVSGVTMQELEASVQESMAVAYERPTIEQLLGVIKSGIGLDISKNHTGIAMWRDGKLEVMGFAIESDYDNNDYMAEAKMRLWFKNKLKEILQGYHWEVCIIEDVYGGMNFSTTRKLIALNCVIDELILEGSVEVDNLYRFKEAEWMRDFRTVIKLGNKLSAKFECQKILEFVQFPFLLEHQNDKPSEKLAIFYEDICDATGQLIGLAMRLSRANSVNKTSTIRLRDLQMYFLADRDMLWMQGDHVLEGCKAVEKEFPQSDIEDTLLEYVQQHPTEVIIIRAETAQLGVFGIKNGFTFYEQGYGYLMLYNKALRKTVRKPRKKRKATTAELKNALQGSKG